MEFPDVYKARSMWQVTGRWGRLKPLAQTSLFLVFPLIKAADKPWGRVGIGS
jgi:hypothetical protein